MDGWIFELFNARSAVVSLFSFGKATWKSVLSTTECSVPNFWHVVVAHSQRVIGRTDSNCVNSFTETQPRDQWACHTAVPSPVATVWLTEIKSAGSPSQTTAGTGAASFSDKSTHTHTHGCLFAIVFWCIHPHLHPYGYETWDICFPFSRYLNQNRLGNTWKGGMFLNLGMHCH